MQEAASGGKSENKSAKFTLVKGERLASRKLIQQLFTENFTVTDFPIRMILSPADLDSTYPAQVLFSVSKKSFPLAVKRNRIKRMMREAYRLKKNLLYSFLDERQIKAAVAFIFTGKSVPDFETIQSKLFSCLLRFMNEYEVSR